MLFHISKIRNMFNPSTSIAICVLLSIQFLGISQASAARSHATSTICQGLSKAGRDLLKYNGTSLEAVGADVTVMCPIIRHRTSKKMRFVNVRFKRKNGDNQKVKGTVSSCDSTYGGCKSTSSSSSSSNILTSTTVDTRSLPYSKDHYFTYHVILPEGWKIVSVEWDSE